MPLPHTSVHLNNENEMPTDLHASRLGKRQISRDVPDGGNPEKRPRYTKTQSHTSSTGGSRRSAMGDLTNRRCVLGDVTNRINIKKSSVSASMSSSVANAGALSKKAIVASKRSLSDISAKSSSVRNANVNAGKRNFRNVTLSSRHAGAMSSSTVTLGSCSSSSVINRMSRPLPVVTPAGTLGSMGLMEKILPADDIIQRTPESDNHDIDSEDKNDPTACWQYAEAITKYHLESEVSPCVVSGMTRTPVTNADKTFALFTFIEEEQDQQLLHGPPVGCQPKDASYPCGLADRRSLQVWLAFSDFAYCCPSYRPLFGEGSNNWTSASSTCWRFGDAYRFKVRRDLSPTGRRFCKDYRQRIHAR
uniref:Uncharacterized protein n=1 Tax=Hyaloperonospora arabidopsidis (strain Emoy2) TaxID=559515 RepID=M4BP09_HYAAE